MKFLFCNVFIFVICVFHYNRHESLVDITEINLLEIYISRERERERFHVEFFCLFECKFTIKSEEGASSLSYSLFEIKM